MWYMGFEGDLSLLFILLLYIYFNNVENKGGKDLNELLHINFDSYNIKMLLRV